MNVVNTIIPIFAIIMLGIFLKKKNFLPPNILSPLNRLVYYLAIPTMIFREIAGSSFLSNFNPLLVGGTLLPLLGAFGLALVLIYALRIPQTLRGTFLQSSFHGNLGYIGFAVCFYFLGKEGLARASILGGFLMLLQNILSVVSLQGFSTSSSREFNPLFFARKVVGNPVIVAVLCGILFSLSGLPMPNAFERILAIVSGMALPLALLVIGASLTFDLIKEYLSISLLSGFLKLIAGPLMGLVTYKMMGISVSEFLPGIILLASPTATITYVMGSEMHGSIELASAAISVNTLLSCITFILWLTLFS
ncbi:MAG: AEC family transporter [Desulfobacteraceae bacterium]|nr:MAG: AEC family transporter [Desulfobacteraceae bacterium]